MTEPTLPLAVDPSLPKATGRGPRTWRWLVAFLVTVAMLLAMTGVAGFAQTGSSGGGPVFVPATAVAYGEVRLDFPGDQHDELAAFMAHFPGFADAGAFDTKLGELLNQVLSSASGGAATWTGNIEPWSNGQLALGLLGLPATTATGPDSTPTTATGPDSTPTTASGSGSTPPMVIGLGIKDRAALESMVGTLVPAATVTTEDYSGTTITTAGDASYAITADYLLVSPFAADIKSSLDVLAGTTPSLADDPDYQAAAASMATPNLAHVYLALSALEPFIRQALSGVEGGEAIAAQVANLPDWLGAYAQVSSDHLTIGGSIPLASGGYTPSIRETDLATRFPASTLAYLEVRDVGDGIDGFLTQLRAQLAADPKDSQTLAGLEQQFGPLDQLFDVVQDAALGISIDGQAISGGIVGVLTDEARTTTRIQTLLGLLRLMGGGASAPYTVTSTDVGGVTVTTITLQATAGIPANLPIEPAISIAISDGHLYVGLGDFVAQALQQDSATSLATAPSFMTALSEAGSPNGGMLWVDLSAAKPIIESIGSANDSSFTTNVGPWLDALDSLVASVGMGDGTMTEKTLLFVK